MTTNNRTKKELKMNNNQVKTEYNTFKKGDTVRLINDNDGDGVYGGKLLKSGKISNCINIANINPLPTSIILSSISLFII